MNETSKIEKIVTTEESLKKSIDKALKNDTIVKTKVSEKKIGLIQKETKPVVTNTDDIVYFRGIVIDKTKTKNGKDFFNSFYAIYLEYQIDAKEVVTVTEQFSFGRNTRLEITVEDQLIVNFFLQPNQDFLKNASIDAITLLRRHLYRLAQNEKVEERY